MLSPAQETTLAAIVEAFAPPDADLSAARALVVAAIGRLPGEKRRSLLTVLNLLGSRAGGALLAAAPSGFARLSHARRERALRALARIGPLRPAYDALSRLALFAAYAVADGAGRNPIWDRLDYPGPRSDVPAVEPLRLEPFPADGRAEADAVVIGSGAGGGVAAALLAQAGFRTVVLEAGPAFEPVAAGQREAEAFAALYLEAGLAATRDLGISILAGACLGGGTAVNWSTSLRLTPAVARDWGERVGNARFAAELADAYDAVETRLGVRVAAAHNRNNGVIVDGCTQLAWSYRAIPRNAACNDARCGYCCFGCAYGTKQSTAVTYLRDAVAAGARVYTNARAERVRIGAGRTRGVDARMADGRMLRVDAQLVVVSAGSLRTPGLLARSGIRSPHLGRHLHLHPTSAISALFSEPIETWHGGMQTALCDTFSDLSGGFGATIEAAPAHPGLMAQATPWTSRDEHAAALASARFRATLIALTRDRGEGSVGLDDRAEVDYRLSREDARHLAAGLAGAARIAFAAGAREVATLHADPLRLDAAGAATASGLNAFEAEIRRRAERGKAPALFSAHQMGTARMAASAKDGVVDAEGRVHGVGGLIVADASVFPTASGVNPMLTIMALAHRATSALIARRAGSRSSDLPAQSRS